MEASFFPAFPGALFKQFLELCDFLLGEIGPLAEMRQQRSPRATEYTLKEGFAFMPHALFAGDPGSIHVRLPLALRGDGAFFGQAREEGDHGFEMPACVLGKRLVNIRCGGGLTVPYD